MAARLYIYSVVTQKQICLAPHEMLVELPSCGLEELISTYKASDPSHCIQNHNEVYPH